MGIDGIGKGGPPATPETQGAVPLEKKGHVEKTFAVEAPSATRASTDAAAIDAASPLARLRAGEIDVNGYVDLKVDEATRALEGLSSSELAEIKRVLRDQMSTDSGLADLARQATGHVPDFPED